jgi:hypothetical protein
MKKQSKKLVKSVLKRPSSEQIKIGMDKILEEQFENNRILKRDGNLKLKSSMNDFLAGLNS